MEVVDDRVNSRLRARRGNVRVDHLVKHLINGDLDVCCVSH